LEGTHGLTVVSEFGIVVVLDQQRIALGRPLHQLSSSRAAQNAAGRELVCGRNDYCIAKEPVDDQAIPVHWLRHELQLMGLDALDLRCIAGILDSDSISFAAFEDTKQEIDCLRSALNNDNPGWIGDYSPSSAEPVRDGDAQGFLAFRLTIIEHSRGRAPDRLFVRR
jgi:hypothetical protein